MRVIKGEWKMCAALGQSPRKTVSEVNAVGQEPDPRAIERLQDRIRVPLESDVVWDAFDRLAGDAKSCLQQYAVGVAGFAGLDCGVITVIEEVLARAGCVDFLRHLKESSAGMMRALPNTHAITMLSM